MNGVKKSEGYQETRETDKNAALCSQPLPLPLTQLDPEGGEGGLRDPAASHLQEICLGFSGLWVSSMQMIMNIHKEGSRLSVGEERAGTLEDRVLETSKGHSLWILVGNPCPDCFPHFCPPP